MLPFILVMPPRVAEAELFNVKPVVVSVPLFTNVAPEFRVTEDVKFAVPPVLFVKEPPLKLKDEGVNVAPL